MAEIGRDEYTQSPCSLIRGGYCVCGFQKYLLCGGVDCMY